MVNICGYLENDNDKVFKFHINTSFLKYAFPSNKRRPLKVRHQIRAGVLNRENKVVMSNFKMKISEHLVRLLIPLACIPLLKMSCRNNTKIFNAACLQELNI